MLCDTVMAVKENAPGNYKGPSNATSVFDADLQAIKDQDYAAVEVPRWVPTRQAKHSIHARLASRRTSLRSWTFGKGHSGRWRAENA